MPPQQFYRNPALFACIQFLEERVEELIAHAKMSNFKLQNLKHQLNHQTGQASKQRKLNVEAQVLTSAEGWKLAEEKEAERAGKEQEKKEVEWIQLQLNWPPDAPFTGSLTSKN